MTIGLAIIPFLVSLITDKQSLVLSLVAEAIKYSQTNAVSAYI
jgi:hypothetical protein